MFEQAEFFCREGDFSVLLPDFVPRQIHDEVAIVILGGIFVRFPFKSPEETLDAGDQGLGAERFGDVVVGSQFQPNDGVGLLRLGGQHNDGE
ncbi:probable transcriptional regulator ycf27 [Nitrospirota bacterium]|nr:probable transcriptional regulator ycf27 [Nitrospirota bacterium]